MKLVINKCYGGFGLSYAAVMAYAKRKGIVLHAYVNAKDEHGRTDFQRYIPYDGVSDAFLIHYSRYGLLDGGQIPNEGHFSSYDMNRDDPDLVSIVEELGDAANGDHAKLKIVEIPDDVSWEISEYDGMESVEEAHRSWN